MRRNQSWLGTSELSLSPPALPLATALLSLPPASTTPPLSIGAWQNLNRSAGLAPSGPQVSPAV